MKLTRRSVLFGLAGTAGLASQTVCMTRAARAASLSAPTGKVILTLSGKIDVTNDSGVARFDRPMLESLGWSSFETKTPWYDGPVAFEGVSMAKVMQIVGAAGDTLVATALNDYSTAIPMSDFTQFNVLLALKRNGEYMPVRDKGPLFIVYPYDSNPVLKSQKYYSRSAWQVCRMAVV